MKRTTKAAKKTRPTARLTTARTAKLAAAPQPATIQQLTKTGTAVEDTCGDPSCGACYPKDDQGQSETRPIGPAGEPFPPRLRRMPLPPLLAALLRGAVPLPMRATEPSLMERLRKLEDAQAHLIDAIKNIQAETQQLGTYFLNHRHNPDGTVSVPAHIAKQLDTAARERAFAQGQRAGQ